MRARGLPRDSGAADTTYAHVDYCVIRVRPTQAKQVHILSGCVCDRHECDIHPFELAKCMMM